MWPWPSDNLWPITELTAAVHRNAKVKFLPDLNSRRFKTLRTWGGEITKVKGQHHLMQTPSSGFGDGENSR